MAATSEGVVGTRGSMPLRVALMEAKAAERSAIVFLSGGLPEVVHTGVDGIVCRDKSVKALVQALKCCPDDPLLAPRHGAAALASLDHLGFSNFAQSRSAAYEAADDR